MAHCWPRKYPFRVISPKHLSISTHGCSKACARTFQVAPAEGSAVCISCLHIFLPIEKPDFEMNAENKHWCEICACFGVPANLWNGTSCN